MTCIFCKIANDEIPSNFIHQDDEVVAFNDLNPEAPTHILIIPRQHIATLNELQTSHNQLIGHMVSVAREIASKQGLADDGYRLVMNCNKNGGQEVFHIHLHLLAGRAMQWPPG